MSILSSPDNAPSIRPRRRSPVEPPVGFPCSRPLAVLWMLGLFFLSGCVVRSVSAQMEPTPTPIPGTLAPAVGDLPDLRFKVDGAGSIQSILDLDDQAVDGDDRNPSTGAPAPLLWSKGASTGFDFLGVGAANELRVTIGAQNSPAQGTAVLTAMDSAGNEISSNTVRVHTTNLLIGAPLVDEHLFLGDSSEATPPYTWCLGSGQKIRIDGLTLGVEGDLSVTIVKGLDSTDFISGSAIVSEQAHSKVLNPYRDPFSLIGSQSGGLAEGVELTAGGLTVQAASTGLEISASAAFSDWLYVSVGQATESGSRDCYSLAIGELLLGTTENLAGSPSGSATILNPAAVYGFENVTLTQLLGAPTVAAYEAAPLAGLTNQSTSWLLSAIGQNGNDLEVPGFGFASLGELLLTTSAPPATYPGAMNNRVLRIELDNPDFCGVLFQHKGLDPAGYSPGDIVTLSINLFVDLNYGGPASEAEINRNINSPVIALALGTQPILESVNYNFVCYPFSENLVGVVAGVEAAINPAAALHGKWTRHEVSFRVPESGVDVTGPSGSGNIANPNSLTAVLLIGRADTSLVNHSQFVYLDNIAISKVPGSLVLAEGATRIPMVSAGWAFAYENGSTGGLFPTNIGFPVPTSIARGQIVHGNFSSNAPNNNPSVILGNAQNQPYSKFFENAAAGWLAELGDDDLSFIAQGDSGVALSFPTLASGAKSLALAPSPGRVFNNYPTPNTGLNVAHAGGVKVNSPYLDMRLISDNLLPGLRVEDAAFPGGGIPGNVSGVFGVRFFHRTNATHVNQNPAFTVVLSNADVNLGLVASRLPNVLTAGNNNSYTGTVWIDDMVSGNFITFSSNQRMDQLTNITLRSSMMANNPGNQLASIQIQRGGAGEVGGRALFLDSVGFNAYQSVYGTGAAAEANADLFPGRYSTATVFVDEIGLHAVRDDRAFYDAELCQWP